jgi:hypothetical protein
LHDTPLAGDFSRQKSFEVLLLVLSSCAASSDESCQDEFRRSDMQHVVCYGMFDPKEEQNNGTTVQWDNEDTGQALLKWSGQLRRFGIIPHIVVSSFSRLPEHVILRQFDEDVSAFFEAPSNQSIL